MTALAERTTLVTGVYAATDSMRIELAPRGVQVVGVHVGLVDTEIGAFSDAPKSSPTS